MKDPSSSFSSATTMDPRIWSKLPPDVVEHILVLLPLKTLLNLRPTCKAFTSLLFSPSFVSKHKHSYSSSSPFSSFLLLSHPQCPHYFRLYDSNLCSWRTLSLSLYNSLPFTLVSSSGGLFCLYNPTSSSFLVYNLFLKSSRKIQSPISTPHQPRITFLTTPLGYYILLLSSNSTSNTSVLVYHSSQLSWRRFEGFNGVLSESCHQQGTFFDGGVYFTTPEPFSVVRFGLESGKWERHVAELPQQLTFVRLMSDGEGKKLYLLGGVGNDGISRSIKLWELLVKGEEEGVWWVEVVSLPENMCRKFVSVCYHNYDHVYCLLHEGIICVCCYMWPEILYYSVFSRTWDWLPRCPYLPLKSTCGFKWFSFLPKLYALV